MTLLSNPTANTSVMILYKRLNLLLSIRRTVSCALFLAAASLANAQVVMGQPRETKAPPQGSGTSASGSTPKPGSLSTLRSAMSKQGPLAQWGPAALRPYASYSFQYGDGLLRVPGEPVNSSLQMLTLGILTEIGTVWTLDGSLTRSMYSSRLLSDTFDSSARLSGRWSFDAWNFGASQGYISNSPIVAETGGQNNERTTTTGADVAYSPGDKLSTDASIGYSRRLADPRGRTVTWTGSDWTQITASGWINYQFTSRFSASVGYLLGWDELSAGDDMSYSRPQVRIRWHPTGRLSFATSWGIERREVDAVGGKKSNSPVYDASVTYNPTLTTSLSLSGTRDTSTSYFNDQTIQTTRVSLGIGQRLLQRYFLSLNASRGESEYTATNTFFVFDRSDEFNSYGASVSTSFLLRGSVSLSYNYNRNASNSNVYQFSSRQLGVNVGYRF